MRTTFRGPASRASRSIAVEASPAAGRAIAAEALRVRRVINCTGPRAGHQGRPIPPAPLDPQRGARPARAARPRPRRGRVGGPGPGRRRRPGPDLRDRPAPEGTALGDHRRPRAAVAGAGPGPEAARAGGRLIIGRRPGSKRVIVGDAPPHQLGDLDPGEHDPLCASAIWRTRIGRPSACDRASSMIDRQAYSALADILIAAPRLRGPRVWIRGRWTPPVSWGRPWRRARTSTGGSTPAPARRRSGRCPGRTSSEPRGPGT